MKYIIALPFFVFSVFVDIFYIPIALLFEKDNFHPLTEAILDALKEIE